MNAQTPGRWEFVEGIKVVAVDFRKKTTVRMADGTEQPHTTGLVALVYDGSVPLDKAAQTQEANGRLMAASPRLLAALKALAGVAVWDEDSDRQAFDAAFAEAESAIAEAECQS